MYYLEKFYNKNFKFELINKFFYKNVKMLPKIRKILLNFKYKATDIKILAKNFLAIEWIINKKGFFKKATQSNLNLKIKKGNPAGCKLVLKKKFAFALIILTEIFLKKFYKLECNHNCLSYTVKNFLNFKYLKNYFYIFNSLPNLNITIITNSFKKNQTLFFKSIFKIKNFLMAK